MTGFQHNVELGARDPVFRLHRRRVPTESVLLDDPGHVDSAACSGDRCAHLRRAFLRHRPELLADWLKLTASRAPSNRTQPLSATDLSGGDLTGGTCPTGYCHLGGAAIPDQEAYGFGLINARNAVNPF